MPGLLRDILRYAPLLAVAALPCAMAQDDQTRSPEVAPITLRDAIDRMFEHNPELERFELRLRAQDGRIANATLRPPIELRAEVENFAGTGTTRRFEGAEATFAISQVIELGGKRDHRRTVALAARDLIEVEREAAVLDAVAEVTRRFIRVAADQEQLALTRRATELARSTLETVQRRVEAARAPEAELHRARIALARAIIEEEHAEHALLTSRRMLAATWAATEADFGAVAGDLFRLPQVPPFQSLVAAIERNPDFLRFASEVRLREAELRLAQSRARADLSLTAGVRRLELSDDQALVLGFSVPLFSGSRTRGAVAEARAQRELVDVEREAHRVQVLARLYGLYQELTHAVAEATTLTEEVLPEMTRALETTRYAYERGRYGFLEWLDAQRERIAVERARIEASANAHLLRAEIERLTDTAVEAATRERSR
jgi:Outer membrane protein